VGQCDGGRHPTINEPYQGEKCKQVEREFMESVSEVSVMVLYGSRNSEGTMFICYGCTSLIFKRSRSPILGKCWSVHALACEADVLVLEPAYSDLGAFAQRPPLRTIAD
jgi:hypothetical protein